MKYSQRRIVTVIVESYREQVKNTSNKNMQLCCCKTFQPQPVGSPKGCDFPSTGKNRPESQPEFPSSPRFCLRSALLFPRPPGPGTLRQDKPQRHSQQSVTTKRPSIPAAMLPNSQRLADELFSSPLQSQPPDGLKPLLSRQIVCMFVCPMAFNG